MFFSIFPLFSEDRFQAGAKFFGLSFHPKGAVNKELMPLKYDPNGYFVQNLGAELTFGYFFIEDIFEVKYVQAFYADCCSQFAGFFHLGLRGRIFRYKNFALYGGIGPSLLYRRNWYNLEGYDDEFSFFRGKPEDYWQYRFLWYGGEFEMEYNIKDNIALAVSFVPGFPDLVSLSAGINIRF